MNLWNNPYETGMSAPVIQQMTRALGVDPNNMPGEKNTQWFNRKFIEDYIKTPEKIHM